MYLDNSDKLGFSTGGTEAVIIDPNQEVGIGVNAPTERLDINGTIRLRDVDTSSIIDTILVIDNNGVVKKSSLNAIESIDSATHDGDTLRIYETSTPVVVPIQTFIKAAGKVNANGTAAKTMFNATVSKIGAAGSGTYQITFINAMPDANYVIQLSQIKLGSGNDDPGITYYDQTTSGFKVEIGDNDNGSTIRSTYDGEFMFTIIDFN